jgi:O-antigen/teichoic acid export membrane protein
VLAVGLVHRDLGYPKLTFAGVGSELKVGFYFSLSISAQSIYTDQDKTMLTRLGPLEAVGIYAAAYRLIDVALTPVRALLDAAYTRFFQHGAGGIQGSLEFTRRLLPIAAAYSLFVGIVLYFAAPVVPALLGADYQNTVEALRWLAVLPILETLIYFAADTLTGADFQGRRSSVQVFVALFNVLISLQLISLYSWRGAAWASITSDVVLALMLYGTLWYTSRGQRVTVG